MATRVNYSRLTKIIYLLHLQNLLLDARILEISRTYVELWPILSQILLPWQPGRVRGKIEWHHYVGHPRKSYARTKNYDSYVIHSQSYDRL